MSSISPIIVDELAREIQDDFLRKAAQERTLAETRNAKQSRKQKRGINLTPLFGRRRHLPNK